MFHNVRRVLSVAVLVCLVGEARGLCVCTTASRVNVRNYPGTSSKVIGQANTGDCFTYMWYNSHRDGYFFLKINFGGVMGYIVNKYVSWEADARCTERPQGICANPETKLTHAEAMRRFLTPNHIPVSSSGRCSDRHNKRCTSLDQIRCKAVRDLVQLKKDSGCYIRVTGGTEIGHSSGTCSHYNGHKIDIALYDCINKYIKNTFTYSGKRGTHLIYKDTRRNHVYYLESHHWDIKYNCP